MATANSSNRVYELADIYDSFVGVEMMIERALRTLNHGLRQENLNRGRSAIEIAREEFMHALDALLSTQRTFDTTITSMEDVYDE